MKKNKLQYWQTEHGIKLPSKDEIYEMAAQHVDEDGLGEIIFRPRPKWDVEQMRKYFHVVCRKFIRGQLANRGIPASEEDIKSALKEKFLGTVEVGGVMIPKPTSSLTFEEYRDFLIDIDRWCMDIGFGSLPSKDDI